MLAHRLVCLTFAFFAGFVPHLAHAKASGWTLAVHSSVNLPCDQFERARVQTDWRLLGVDEPPKIASRALWVRATSEPAAQAAAVVSHNLIRAIWFDYSDPLQPLRITSRTLGGNSAPSLLSVTLPTDAKGPVFLCLTDFQLGVSQISIRTVELMDLADLRIAQQRSLSLLAGVIGVMLAMSAFALTFFIGLKERVFAYYSVYVFCFAGYVLHNADVLSWLMPESLKEGPTSPILALLMMTLMVAAGLRFTHVFTGVGAAWPRVSRFTIVLSQIAMVGALINISGYLFSTYGSQFRLVGNLVFNSAVGLLILSVMLPVAHQAWRGSYSARVYVIGWLPPLAVLLGIIFRLLGITPESLRPSSEHLLLAAAFESLVLGWGLAERARFYRIERVRAVHVAEHDPLTGALNRTTLDSLLSSALETKAASTLLYLDIDHFKRINDVHGHAVGDAVLQRFATCCQAQLRGVDHLVRHGGEEFLAILAQTDVIEARRVGERIRLAVASDSGARVPITVSIGVAVRQTDDSTETWIERADRALYLAKNAGRNCLVEIPA